MLVEQFKVNNVFVSFIRQYLIKFFSNHEKNYKEEYK